MVNGRLPAAYHALVDTKIVSRFVELENLQDQMRLYGNEFAIKLIAN